MNNDVCTEILLHLSVESLLRFRVVCKFWGHVIDSPSFRKLQIHNNNISDDMVRLEFYFDNGRLRVLHNTKVLMSYKSDHLMGFEFNSSLDNHEGQLKLLPPITTSPYSDPSPCKIIKREVAIGFDEDYKVAQLLLCMSWLSCMFESIPILFKHRCSFVSLENVS
ncbi:F-box protein-like protein [Salvia divinorum]|uniref:F-box protein-like protein n=1 Tax=Salvia divinorum TaxID=28513 RepID=A0ABD1IHJ1_SALDI